MDIKNMMGGGVLKYALIGIAALAIPALMGRFMPSWSGWILGAVLIGGGVMLRGKLPGFASGALIVTGVMTIAAPLLSGVIGETGAASTSGLDLA